jgi:hypothetical protein
MTPDDEAAAGAAKRPAPTPPQRRRRRRGEILFVAIVAILMAGAAYFQEEIGYFFQLQAWNPGKPGQTVTSFLMAGREGKQSETDRYIDVNLFHPLEENGKFVGYQVGTTVGSLEYRFNELAAPGAIRPTNTELVFKGNGAAMVTVPDASGKPVPYRLVMQGGSWKITEIRAGRLRR